MTTWTIRRATESDATSVADCAVEAFRHYIPRLGLTPIPMTRDYGAAIANVQVWIATQRGETIAALVLDTTDEGFLIDVIAVLPQHQGTGVGRALLELAEQEALRQGHDSIYLFTNEKMTENRALYERIGYVEYKRLAFAERTRVFLRKPLK
ncbi:MULTISPECIES: GNAT family N-acetyltransferase [Variovorax]|jgi:GNAT superfamily N-acetyltransferase|uniref:GNAT family N-acetyltransferase n=1 Tax=Variovorax TaxID=34072 RepID=UPI0008C79761|nr:GNAT family N-acetyltransferase [Variovorax sp. OV084]SET43133.1 Ribosomal protein S18 acetylase RimI [Variovorax sp. OV084]